MKPIYIAGAGIIGLLTAREFIRADRPVVVLERQSTGRESSWAGGGILSPLYPWRYAAEANALARHSQALYPALCSDLLHSTGIDPEWTASGLLMLDVEDGEVAQNWVQSQQRALTSLQGQALQDAEPALAATGHHGLLLADVAQVRNPRLLAALRAELLRSGVEIRENVTITGFTHETGRLTGMTTDSGNIPATQCVVATGAWTGELLANTGIALEIEPVRGQMLLFQATPGLLSHILLQDYHYLIPRRDGHILVGSTLEPAAGFDKTTTVPGKQELQQAALELVPALADYPVVRQWAGLRPGSPKGIPYIDEHPKIAGLYLCAGHYRNGFALGPASARLVADLVLQRKPTLKIRPYRVDRD